MKYPELLFAAVSAAMFVFGWVALLISWWSRRRTRRMYLARYKYHRESYRRINHQLVRLQELRQLEEKHMITALDNNERLRSDNGYLRGLLIGITNLVNELSYPKKPGDPQLPGEHPFVYGMNDHCRKTLIERLGEIALTMPPDDHTKTRS